jgi:hypothetical protein
MASAIAVASTILSIINFLQKIATQVTQHNIRLADPELVDIISECQAMIQELNMDIFQAKDAIRASSKDHISAISALLSEIETDNRRTSTTVKLIQQLFRRRQRGRELALSLQQLHEKTKILRNVEGRAER